MQTIVGRIFALVIALTMFSSGDLWAKIDECQPDGMSDEEAARIIAIATDQGQKFRKTIDDLRAQGITYETDTTYENIMADPERALAWAREHYSRTSVTDLWVKYQLDQGRELNEILRKSLKSRILRINSNYFIFALENALKQLAVSIGGKPINSLYSFELDSDDFIFAFRQFTIAADLKYVGGRKTAFTGTIGARYGFTENWSLFRKDALYRLQIDITTNLDRSGINLEQMVFGPPDLLKGGWPLSTKNNRNCFETISRVE